MGHAPPLPSRASAEAEAEVQAQFERYESALRRHDVEALNDFFVRSPSTVRYGVAEENYGFDAIAAYRRASAEVHPGRRLLRTLICCVAEDVVCVSAEFSDPSSAGLGRQTQTWVRTGGGWKIAVAHVSMSRANR